LAQAVAVASIVVGACLERPVLLLGLTCI